MDAFKNLGGFFIAIWSYLLSRLPSAPQLLLYISIALGLMQLIVVTPKAWRVLTKLFSRRKQA